ncbi:hypothetical protein [Microbacterium sp.]|uniref:hypothetical protein n=1 Tax=Microbacterium sp. TaxID=51671 RepID=UPI00281124C4|nr:hypothetical protein [Microbacterium sp.]
MNAFTGLSAFPLAPLKDDVVDEASFVRLVERLAGSGVESITVLGRPAHTPSSRLTSAPGARVAEVVRELALG